MEVGRQESRAAWAETTLAAAAAFADSSVPLSAADFASFASIPAGGQGAPGPFELRLHLRSGSTSQFLPPLSTGYVRIRATAVGSGRTALSDVASFTVPERPAPGTFILVK